MTKRTAFYHWKIPSTIKPGKLVKSTYRMDEKTAQERFPGCEKVPGEPEWRNLPESQDEAMGDTHTKVNNDGKR
jgi:hypothetical protein